MQETGNLLTKQLNQLEADRHIAHSGILKSCSIKRADDILGEFMWLKITKKNFTNNNRNGTSDDHTHCSHTPNLCRSNFIYDNVYSM